MTSIDTAEDTPGLPNFLNRNHPNCKWRSNVKPGPKETALREQRKPEAGATLSSMAKAITSKVSDVTNISMAELNMTPPKTNGHAAPAAKAKPEAKPQTKQETTVKTTTKTKPAAKAATPKKAAPARVPKAKAGKKAARANARTPLSARPDGLREGSKQAVMLDMALRQEGATEHAICGKLGWKKCRVTLRRVCEKVGAKLETRKNAKQETVFFATLKAKA